MEGRRTEEVSRLAVGPGHDDGLGAHDVGLQARRHQPVDVLLDVHQHLPPPQRAIFTDATRGQELCEKRLIFYCCSTRLPRASTAERREKQTPRRVFKRVPITPLWAVRWPHLAAHVATLLGAGLLVLKVHARGAALDEQLRQLHHGRQTTAGTQDKVSMKPTPMGRMTSFFPKRGHKSRRLVLPAPSLRRRSPNAT